MNALGVPFAIGSLEDGTDISETARRAYGPMLRQLLRAAHWNFARAVAKLELLGDASGNSQAPQGYPTGQSPPPGPGVPISNIVEPPWVYAYAWPGDGVAARWLPWRLEPVPSNNPPLYTGQQNSNQLLINQHPARFLVSSSNQYPTIVDPVDWDRFPDFESTEGVGPIGRRIILTNVPFAHLVYTRLVLSIEEWDPMFEETMVAFMAQRLALVACKAAKMSDAEAIKLRNDQIGIVKEQLMEARTRNANDAGFPQTPDHIAPWTRARRYGGSRWGAGGLGIGPGVLGYGWDTLSMGSGNVF
ncbi:MAG TPA: hypothetical protein VKS24_25050 [Bradyrhizobium sp.]|nr:hypothetical protein [Bradyrhizobium sp.]